jgi:uncharacterized protein YdeI (YjbR/CyaY-like superfamily)
MADELSRITDDPEYIIDNFKPVLDELRNNQGSPIFLSSFPNLRKLYNNGDWVITLLKAALYDNKAIQLLKYDEKHRILQFYIILDEVFFKSTAKKTKEMKNIIIVHEFIHFLAFFYSSINADEETIRKELIGRISLTSGGINKNTPSLQKLLDKEYMVDDFYSYEQVNDAHFRTGIEKMPLDYAELFRNFLLPIKMLYKYLTPKARKKFFNLLNEHKRNKAQSFLKGIINKISNKESLPVNFVISQTTDLIMRFHLNER